MTISNENIEVFIYDYFEENLDESEKTELMEFLHKNPEFEADFTSYAQSYALTGEKELDYGLSEKLLQKDKSTWLKRYKYPLTGTILISIAAFLATFFFKTEQAELKPKENHYSQSKLPAVKEAIEQNQPAVPEKTTNLVKSKKRSIVTFPKPKEEIRIEEISILEKNQNLKPEKQIQKENYKNIESTISLDSSGNIPIVDTLLKASEKKETQESKKKKRKRKIDFKPSSEFLEINPNF